MTKIIIALSVFATACVSALTVGFALSICNILSWAFVATKFYVWFVHPVFSMLPSISFFQMAGLYMFAKVFNTNYTTTSANNKTLIAVSMVTPWVWLFVGWFFTII